MKGTHPRASQDRPEGPPDPSLAGVDRIVALDTLRGLAIFMFLIVNTSGIRAALPYQLDHAAWHGLTFSDTFFPVFLFAMGAAMEVSTRAGRPAAVAQRVAALFALGLFLQWLRLGGFVITGVLQKIAFAYLVAWLMLQLPRRLHLPIAVLALLAMWAGFVWASPAGVEAGSWERGTNFAAYIDRLVLGRPATEGIASGLMSTVNVLGGVVVMRSIRSAAKGDTGSTGRPGLQRILLWAGGGIAAGLLMALGGAPINKRIWTPSFVVLTHGIACAYLALFWLVTQMGGWRTTGRKLATPFVALGRNPVLIFVGFTALHELITPVRLPAMEALAPVVGDRSASFIWSGALAVAGISLALWMNRRKIYVRV